MPNDPAVANNGPAIVLSWDPPGPHFSISASCAMPAITATATLRNIVPAAPPEFRWQVTLGFSGQGCAHSRGRIIRHPEIDEATESRQFAIPFSAVRGGDLTVRVSVTMGAVTLTAESAGLQIVGTNPSVTDLRAATEGATDGFKRLMRLESGLRQFRAPGCPLFSADGLGGVGLCQLTSPAPTDDQVWSWRENLKAGLALYQGKQGIAKAWPAQVRKSAEFKALVKSYNDRRMASGLHSLTIDLPEYTPEQLEKDTLRGFNGYAGQLHEYRAKIDSNGMLVVSIDSTGTKGVASWERLTAAQRTAYYDKIGLAENRRGDVNYVDDVEAEASL